VENEIEPFVERYRLLPGIQEHGAHPSGASFTVRIVHQSASRACASTSFINNQIVDMQIWTASQGVDRSHAHDAYQSVIEESPDKFIAGICLALHPGNEFVLIQSAQLHDYWICQRPLCRR
jgi:hypothetical protein